MTDYFLDSSALVKRYVPEQGTTWIRATMLSDHGQTILVSQITAVEITSGVMRRQREASISPRTGRAIRLLLERHLAREYLVIGLSAKIVQSAQNLLVTHPLRAYDAVQLASALESRARFAAAQLPPPIFVSSDRRLLEAAAAEGFAVDDPNAYP